MGNTLNYKKTRFSCFFAYLAMSSVFSFPPMLFVTFHNMYGISYTLVGSLILVNFFTQLLIDLVFTFFSKHFNIKLTIRVMPLITTCGLLIYSLVPMLLPQYAVYGLLGGTIIFSVSAGLSEVLLSPVVASLPSETPEKDMALLHSLYGWGVLMVVAISSLFFKIFTTEKWNYLALFWAFLPLVSSFLFCSSPIPDMQSDEVNEKREKNSGRTFGIVVCAVCIFLGSSTENIMTGWISSYMENALGISKTVGDILGMALFALLLAFTRSIYAKYGKNIYKFLLISFGGSIICYLVVGLSPKIIISFIACVVTGIFTSMLWPGTLIFLEEKVPSPGVAAYALMAAAGDMGAAFAPQLVGVIIDKVSISNFAAEYITTHNVSGEVVGFRAGMLFTAVLPILGLVWLLAFGKNKKSKGEKLQ